MFRPPDTREIALTPGARVRKLANMTGETEVAGWCTELLSGSVEFDDPRRPAVSWLGGRHAARLLAGRGFELRGQDYWPRVWGARGLLYVWRPNAEAAILSGLHDPAWRVREMCAKVVRHRAIESAESALARLVDDPVSRVRAAADAALTATRDRPD